jgi:hypothetical protein
MPSNVISLSSSPVPNFQARKGSLARPGRSKLFYHRAKILCYKSTYFLINFVFKGGYLPACKEKRFSVKAGPLFRFLVSSLSYHLFKKER